jgi:hypothetical protein
MNYEKPPRLLHSSNSRRGSRRQEKVRQYKSKKGHFEAKWPFCSNLLKNSVL